MLDNNVDYVPINEIGFQWIINFLHAMPMYDMRKEDLC